jgi:hypothetical protein
MQAFSGALRGVAEDGEEGEDAVDENADSYVNIDASAAGIARTQIDVAQRHAELSAIRRLTIETHSEGYAARKAETTQHNKGGRSQASKGRASAIVAYCKKPEN